MTRTPLRLPGRTCRIASLALTALTMAAGGCASDKSTINNAVAANSQLEPAIIEDPALSAYIQQVGDRVVTAAKWYDAKGQGPDGHKKEDSAWMFSKDMKFHLVNSKTVNAFTTGGNHMYVYSALFQMCTSEDELAAVMAHEFAHVYSRHVQSGTNRQTGATVVSYLGYGAGYVAGGSANGASYADTGQKAVGGLAQFAGLGYTRADEAQADEWGFKFYSQAGWDPNRFGDFFQAMIDAGYETKDVKSSDHPSLASRVALAKEHAATWAKFHPNDTSRRPEVADAAKFAQIKQQTAAVCAALPDDSQTKKAQTLLASFNSCVAPTDQPEQAAAKKELLVLPTGAAKP